MKKIRNLLIAVIAITSLITTSTFAGSFGVGVSGNMASVSASGTETSGDAAGAETENSVQKATAGNQFGFGSIFAEYNFGDSERFTLGVDYIPGDADINSTTLSRTDASGTYVGYTAQQSGTQKANASISDHVTYYAELGIVNGVYVKAGFAQVNIDVTQATVTGYGKYEDKTLDAVTYGIGYKGGFGNNGFFKVEGFVYDYDSYSDTSSSANANKVTADLDVTGAKLAIGYKF